MNIFNNWVNFYLPVIIVYDLLVFISKFSCCKYMCYVLIFPKFILLESGSHFIYSIFWVGDDKFFKQKRKLSNRFIYACKTKIPIEIVVVYFRLDPRLSSLPGARNWF